MSFDGLLIGGIIIVSGMFYFVSKFMCEDKFKRRIRIINTCLNKCLQEAKQMMQNTSIDSYDPWDSKNTLSKYISYRHNNIFDACISYYNVNNDEYWTDNIEMIPIINYRNHSLEIRIKLIKETTDSVYWLIINFSMRYPRLLTDDMYQRHKNQDHDLDFQWIKFFLQQN